MRRFSQRQSLVTLNEINITPLLDLAFVLLIIFIIVAGSLKPSSDNAIDLNLPKGGGAEREVDVKDIRVVSVTRQGQYFLGDTPVSLDAIERALANERRTNPKMVVKLRLDESGINKDSVALLDRLTRNNIAVSLATQPLKKP